MESQLQLTVIKCGLYLYFARYNSLKSDIHVDENYVSDLPSRNKLESMHAEVESILNVDCFLGLDIGFKFN